MLVLKKGRKSENQEERKRKKKKWKRGKGKGERGRKKEKENESSDLDIYIVAHKHLGLPKQILKVPLPNHFHTPTGCLLCLFFASQSLRISVGLKTKK